jgi:hypothetical protein
MEAYSLATFGFDNVYGKKDGNLGSFNKDELLDIVTYYWMTNCIASSVRYYKTNLGLPKNAIKQKIRKYPTATKIPVGVQYFKHEVYVMPLFLIKKAFPNLQKFTQMKQGGHFASFENPSLTAVDLFEFIKIVH